MLLAEGSTPAKAWKPHGCGTQWLHYGKSAVSPWHVGERKVNKAGMLGSAVGETERRGLGTSPGGLWEDSFAEGPTVCQWQEG